MPIGPWIATHITGGRLMLASLSAAGAVMGLSSHLVSSVCGIAFCGALLQVRRHRLAEELRHQQELALRKELLAYLLFNGSPRSMAAPELGRQLSRLIAVRSSFGRAALLLRDDAGALGVVGSAGFDDLSVEALNRWGQKVSPRDLSLAEIAAGCERVATSSFTLTLDRRCAERNPLSTMSCKEVHIVPLRTASGLVGALVVCARPRSSARSADPLELLGLPGIAAALPVADMLQPLEALALRLTMQFAAPENVTPVWPARTVPRQERHTRSAKGRERASRSEEETNRRSLDERASPLGALSTTAALERVRRILNPVSAPLPCVSGVSGRPPARVWR